MHISRQVCVVQVGKFYPPHLGGMETHLKLLCEELRKSTDVRVIVANEGREDKEEQIAGVTVERLGQLFSAAGAPVCPSMTRVIRRSSADLVHIHLPNPTAVLSYLASGHRGPLIVTWHSDIVRQKLLGAVYRPVERRFLNRCGAIIASSPNYLSSSARLAEFRDRCHIIPFAIPSAQFERSRPERVAAIREHYGPGIILCVGRLVYYKGIEYMLRAMADIPGRLLVIGDGPLRQQLQEEARSIHGRGRVEFLGRVDDLNPFYQACDVFVLSSVARSEAFGIVQLEAMACGKPVVNTRLASGVPFVSVDGETGLTVPPRDPEALANAVNTLLENPELRERYGQAGRCRVRTKFSLAAMTNRTLDLYEEVLSLRTNHGAETARANPQKEISGSWGHLFPRRLFGRSHAFVPGTMSGQGQPTPLERGSQAEITRHG